MSLNPVSRTARYLFLHSNRSSEPLLSIVVTRCFSTPAATEMKPVRINENLSFRPAYNSHLEPSRRPIVLVYGWLVAKAQHIHKYGDFYLGKGFDVLHIKINPLQLLWPRRAQSVISQTADFITDGSRSSQPILVHGFSVGGYLYGEMLVKFVSEPDRFGDMSERVRGQIFDSPVDFTGIPYGVGRAVTQVPVLQKCITAGLELYLRLFKSSVTQYFQRSSATFYSNPLHCPSLVFYSKSDLIGAPGPIENLIRGWKNSGILVHSKCWEETPHVGHFRHHPVQYINTLNNFLSAIGLQPDVKEGSEMASVSK